MLEQVDRMVARTARGLTRRRLLRDASGGALGAALFVSAGSEKASAATGRSAASRDVKDPSFLMGQVSEITDDGGLTVIDLDGNARRAKLESSSRHWKAGTWNEVDYAVGDCVMGRGELDAEQALHIDKVWANIGKINGKLTTKGSKKVKIKKEKTDKLLDVDLTDATIVRDDDGNETHGSAEKLKADEDVVLIAYTDPATNALVAHRLEAYQAFGADQTSPEPGSARSRQRAHSADHGAFSVARRGNASYFCCGGVHGCNDRCGSLGSNGYCGFCRSDSNYMAWPQVGGCGPYCSGCCLEAGYPRYGCGTGFDIENPWVWHGFRHREPVPERRHVRTDRRLRPDRALPKHRLQGLRLGPLRPDPVRVYGRRRQPRHRPLQPLRQRATLDPHDRCWVTAARRDGHPSPRGVHPCPVARHPL
jgi:hypothetical protein